MQIEVKGRNLQVTDEMREYVARRFDKIGKQVSELAVLEIEVADENVPGDPVAAAAVLHLKGTQLRAKEVEAAGGKALKGVLDERAHGAPRAGGRSGARSRDTGPGDRITSCSLPRPDRRPCLPGWWPGSARNPSPP